MLIYYKELSLEEGFEISDLPKNSRIVAGREVSTCSGWPLFSALRNGPISCWECGCTADRWIVGKGPSDVSRPVLNLYAYKRLKSEKHPRSIVTMLTRDHIIPKSLGGVDWVQNLRPACEICNHGRGSHMNDADKAFMEANPHLISAERLVKAQERQKSIPMKGKLGFKSGAVAVKNDAHFAKQNRRYEKVRGRREHNEDF